MKRWFNEYGWSEVGCDCCGDLMGEVHEDEVSSNFDKELHICDFCWFHNNLRTILNDTVTVEWVPGVSTDRLEDTDMYPLVVALHKAEEAGRELKRLAEKKAFDEWSKGWCPEEWDAYYAEINEEIPF